jgi:Uma2 family endonuclease
MATATLPTTRITPEQFLELPEGKRYELVHGELVECPAMSVESSRIAILIASLLQAFVGPRGLGYVLGSDVTYQCFPNDPDLIRRPDVSFLREGRLPPDQYEYGHCRIAPDLAVEVISPNDIVFELEEKIQEYLSAGVELVWLFSAKSKSVTVYRLHGKTERYEVDSAISGESVLPGFEFKLSEIFP